MTTPSNPILLQTPERSTLRASEAGVRSSERGTDRFRDSLERRVTRDETTQETRSDRSDRTRENRERATDDAQETRRGADDAGSSGDARTTEGVTGRADDRTAKEDGKTEHAGEGKPTGGKETSGDASEKNDGSEKNGESGERNADGSASQPVVHAGPSREEARVDAHSVKAADRRSTAGAEGQSKQTSTGSVQTQTNPSAGTSAGARPDASQQSANADRPVVVTPDGGEGGDEQPTPVRTSKDDPGVRSFGAQSASSGERPSGQSVNASQTQGSLAGATIQQQSGGGETSSDGGDSSGRREQNPALKLAGTDAQPGRQASSAGAFHLESVPSAAGGREIGEAARTARGPVPQGTGASGGAEAAQNERAVSSSVSRGLAAAVQQRGGSLTIRLSPESLGQVRVDLEMSQGRVTASLHASTERAQEAMVKNIAMLRSSLESKGLSVDRLTVQLAPASASGGQQTSNDQTGQDGGRHQSQSDRDASDGQSRGSRDGERRHGGGRGHGGFDERFEDAFGLEPDDPRAQTLRLRLSAIG